MKKAAEAAARPRGSVRAGMVEGCGALEVSFMVQASWRRARMVAHARISVQAASMSSVLDLSRRLLALSQTGLHFTVEEYDRERYREIGDIAARLLELQADVGA